MEKDEGTYQKLLEECRQLRHEIKECRVNQLSYETSSANLNSLINNQDASIWSIDNAYCYVIFNDFFKKAYLKTFNIELQKGTNALDILSPDLKKFWKDKYDLALGGQRLKFEFSTPINDDISTFSIDLNPVFINGVVTGVNALSREITDQKKAAKRLADSNANMLAIMENTLESIWAINTSYEILFTNSVFKREFNQSFGVELKKGVNILESLPLPLKPTWKARYDRALSGERFSFIDEIDIGIKVIFIEVSMNPMLDENNSVIGASFFANDITDRVVAQKALKENEARLHELNITKDKFFSIIAHDLKSPFNSIVGLSDLLVCESEKGNEIKGISKIIQNASHQAMDLISNLLEWSRSQSGRLEFNPEHFEVSTVINNELDSIANLAKQKQITLENQIPDNLLAYGDKYMIGSVFRNLLSNAIKFTNIEGNVKVSTYKNENFIVFVVADNGVGISCNDIDKLFKIDVNHSTSGTQNEQGTGLGLILCKEFISKHMGKIWAKSKINKGSEFSFSLPLNKY